MFALNCYCLILAKFSSVQELLLFLLLIVVLLLSTATETSLRCRIFLSLQAPHRPLLNAHIRSHTSCRQPPAPHRKYPQNFITRPGTALGKQKHTHTEFKVLESLPDVIFFAASAGSTKSHINTPSLLVHLLRHLGSLR